MASAWGVSEGLVAVAEHGPPPAEFARLTRWLAECFGVGLLVTDALPAAVLGAYFIIPVACRYGALIMLRDTLRGAMRRWTLLHELGHHLTGTVTGTLTATGGAYGARYPAERAADACAAALALPDGDALWAALRGGAAITEVAAAAGIPERGAFLRCKQLGIAPLLQLEAARWGLADWPDAADI